MGVSFAAARNRCWAWRREIIFPAPWRDKAFLARDLWVSERPMYPKIIPAVLAGLTLILAGCGRQQNTAASKAAESAPKATELVKDTERSRHFAAVNSRLELGGTIYGYVDIDGDAAKLAERLCPILRSVAFEIRGAHYSGGTAGGSHPSSLLPHLVWAPGRCRWEHAPANSPSQADSRNANRGA